VLGHDFVSPAVRRSRLTALLKAGRPVEVPGAHDVLSAMMVEQAGFEALLVSGFGLSASSLGLPDVEVYTRSDNVAVVRNVVMATSTPVMADIDDGYGSALNVMRTVREFELAGASSVTLEDQVFPKKCPLYGEREDLLSLEEASNKIKAAVAARSDPSMLIIARTDAHSPQEAIRRAKAYAEAGADLIKPISSVITSVEILRDLRRASGRPLSVSMLGWLARQVRVLDELHDVVGIATHPLMSVLTAARAVAENLAAIRNGTPLHQLPVAPLAENDFRHIVGTDTLLAIDHQYSE